MQQIEGQGSGSNLGGTSLTPTDTLTAAGHCEDIAGDPDGCGQCMWATVPMLRQALEVMEVWGFRYKSSLTWVKTTPAPAIGL